MKSPFEIKKSLLICAKSDKCDGCAYLTGKYTCDSERMMKDALKYIETLENKGVKEC